MSKVKLDHRFNKALNAFFETELDRSQFALTYVGGDVVSIADQRTFAEKADIWMGNLRAIFLFGPGTFVLFFSTLKSTFYYPGVGTSPYWYLLAIFCVYAGSGSIKNIKNLVVPAVVITMALVVVFFSLVFVGREVADQYFWDSIYLFPLVLIAAKLTQNCVSD